MLSTGKCLRVLGDAEVPLFVQYGWKGAANAAQMTFVLKEREAEIRENATKARPSTLRLTTGEGYCVSARERNRRA
jgi:hypothetical protein